GRCAAIAADYAWAGADEDDLFSAYCLTLVRGIAPREFMERIHARVIFDDLPLGDTFYDMSYGCWDLPYQGDVQFIVATTVAGACGEWTLAFEVNGHLGVTPELMAPVSAGTRLVSHRDNSGNGFGYFYWIEDGDIRLGFEPIFAYTRSGSTPDAVVADMREI